MSNLSHKAQTTFAKGTALVETDDAGSRLGWSEDSDADALEWREDADGDVFYAVATQPPPLPEPPPPLAPAPKSSGRGPVFSGDLGEFCIPDLLEFLRNARRTGLLMCTTTMGIGRVQLLQGMIVGADSPNALDLRRQLLNNPELAPERRAALAVLPAESFRDEAIDAAIAARDLVPRDEVERARVARIYSAVREMIGWTSGRFSFDPEVVMTNPAPALNAQSILMQLCREHDETSKLGDDAKDEFLATDA
jgi:hypothetical protein